MFGYALRRVLTAIPIVLLTITVCFFILRLAPGGPFDGERALPPDVLKNLRAHYNLDQPIWVQYFIYLGGVLQGNFGPSMVMEDFSVGRLISIGLPFTLIANPDNSATGFFNNYSAVFNNKIVSRYVTAAGPRQLASFDGTQWTILPNPDNTPNRGVQPIFPTLYKNKLYFTYLSATSQYQLMEYDGISNPTLIANPQNSSINNGGLTLTPNMSIVYNDTLFFQYYDVNNV